jgi:hypothetical protein
MRKAVPDGASRFSRWWASTIHGKKLEDKVYANAHVRREDDPDPVCRSSKRLLVGIA